MVLRSGTRFHTIASFGVVVKLVTLFTGAVESVGSIVAIVRTAPVLRGALILVADLRAGLVRVIRTVALAVANLGPRNTNAAAAVEVRRNITLGNTATS